jgi:hypothetical protein
LKSSLANALSAEYSFCNSRRRLGRRNLQDGSDIQLGQISIFEETPGTSHTRKSESLHSCSYPSLPSRRLCRFLSSTVNCSKRVSYRPGRLSSIWRRSGISVEQPSEFPTIDLRKRPSLQGRPSRERSSRCQTTRTCESTSNYRSIIAIWGESRHRAANCCGCLVGGGWYHCCGHSSSEIYASVRYSETRYG